MPASANKNPHSPRSKTLATTLRDEAAHYEAMSDLLTSYSQKSKKRPAAATASRRKNKVIPTRQKPVTRHVATANDDDSDADNDNDDNDDHDDNDDDDDDYIDKNNTNGKRKTNSKRKTGHTLNSRWDEEQFADGADEIPNDMENDTHEIDLHDTTDERRAKKARTPTKRANVVGGVQPPSPKKRTPSKSLAKRTTAALAVAHESMVTPPPAAQPWQQEGSGEDRVEDSNLRINSIDLDTLLPSHKEWKITRNARRSTASPSEIAAAGTVRASPKPVPWYKAARRPRGMQLSDTDGHTDNERTRGGQYDSDVMDLDEAAGAAARRVRAGKKRAIPKATTKPPAKKRRSRKPTTTEEEEEEEEEERNGENWSARSTERYEHAWQADGEVEEDDGEEEVEEEDEDGEGEGEVVLVGEEEEEEDPPLHRRRKSALQKLQREIVHAADPIILPRRRTTRSANASSPIAFNHQHDNDAPDDIQDPLHTPPRIIPALAGSRSRRRKLPIRTVIDPKEWDMTQDVSQASVTSPTKIDEDASETFSPSRSKKRTRTGGMRVNRDELAPITVGVPAGVKEGGTGKQRAKRVTARKAKLKDAKGEAETEMLTVVSPSQENIEVEDDEADVAGVAMLPRKRARPAQADNGLYVIVPSLQLPTQPIDPKKVTRRSSVRRETSPSSIHVPDPDAVVVEIVSRKTSKAPRVTENERSLSPTGKGRTKSKGKARASEIAHEDDDQDTQLIPSTFDESSITSASTNITETAKQGAVPTLASLSRQQQPSGSGSNLLPPPSLPQPAHKFATPADTIWSRTRFMFGGSASPSISTPPPPPSIATGADVSTRKRKSDSYSSASSSSSGGGAAISVSTSASVASSQKRWQDGGVVSTPPDRRLTASPHGSINGNSKKWSIKEWQNLEDWYEREACDIEKAVEGFWKEHRIIIKGEPGRDDYVGQGQEVELWNREEVLKRCKALHRNIIKYGGESPRKRYRYSSVSSSSSMTSIASRTSVMPSARMGNGGGSMPLDATMGRASPFSQPFSQSYHTSSPLSASLANQSQQFQTPLPIRRLSDMTSNSGDNGGGWIDFSSSNVVSTINRMEEASIDVDVDASLQGLRLESNEPGSRRGSIGSIESSGRGRVREVVQRLERQEMERQEEEERRRSRSRTYSPSFKLSTSQSFVQLPVPVRKSSSPQAPERRARAVTPNGQRGNSSHASPMPEKSVSTPVPKKGPVTAVRQAPSSIFTTISQRMSNLIGWSANSQPHVESSQTAQDGDIMDED